MNFTQMHERLRLELLRRIERGTLSVSLLARQTGFGQPHLSNFLHSRRQLSLDGLDRVLAAQHLTAADLLPAPRFAETFPDVPSSSVPLVTHHAALFEPNIRPATTIAMLHLPPGALQQPLRTRASTTRRAWERFVAVRVPAADAAPMNPLVLPEAIALLDRHYTSFVAYSEDRPNLYAIRHGAHLTLRFADFVSNRLLLRPQSLAFPVELIEIDPGESPADLIAGRVALVLNET